ncbi:MAG: sigma-70 family RNA polymerase sigma factor [Kofleriaceae bacterium]
MRFVMRALGSLGAPSRDLEDLAQEVFVVAHRRIAQFDASRRPEPWLYGIARNVLRDYRRRACQREVPSGDALPARSSGRGPVDADVELLRRALATLDEPLQDVLLLCDLAELTVRETAEALALPEGTLKDRLRRARTQLPAPVNQLETEVAHV